MDSRIKTGMVQSYTTTDGKSFAGKGAKKAAEGHQWSLNKRNLLMEFDVFMRKIFGIKCKYIANDYSDEEENFCNEMMKEVNVNADDGDFRGEVSDFIIDLFGFIGQVRWQQIHDFLIKNR